MSDPKAQVDMARVALRRAIAGAMVRKEQAESALSPLRAEIERRTANRQTAEAAGDAALVADIVRALDDLRDRADVHEHALATAENDIETLKEELRSMDGLEREAERLAAVTAVQKAAEAPSAERETLSRVRESIDSLSAEADLNDELNETSRLDREIERQTSEAAAKARLAELKAQAAERKAAGEADDPPRKAQAADHDAAEDAAGPPPPNKPKRTM